MQKRLIFVFYHFFTNCCHVFNERHYMAITNTMLETEIRGMCVGASLALHLTPAPLRPDPPSPAVPADTAGRRGRGREEGGGDAATHTPASYGPHNEPFIPSLCLPIKHKHAAPPRPANQNGSRQHYETATKLSTACFWTRNVWGRERGRGGLLCHPRGG